MCIKPTEKKVHEYVGYLHLLNSEIRPAPNICRVISSIKMKDRISCVYILKIYKSWKSIKCENITENMFCLPSLKIILP